MIKKSLTTYIKHRTNKLKEERKLVYERDKLSKQLREIRRELNQWDNWLITK